MQQNFIENIKKFFIDKKKLFKELDKSKKYAIIIAVVAILLATVFSISYSIKNKYGILFSGLDTYDAASISEELESQGVDMKVEGDTIYVPKKEVDKLRIELSPSISNGSKGFELMDEGSDFSMTDEEFEIKKLRMFQGELEKTIKTFPQVEDAKVHITQGEESVFTKDSDPGKAAVYITLKSGNELDKTQVKSIMSLVSASSKNIPKQNVEVIDQNMTLLSEGIYDEEGNSLTGASSTNTRAAEKQLNEELQNSLIGMLESVFGKGKVKATVNSALSLDTVEKTSIEIDPDKVIKSEVRSENSTSDSETTGSPVDNNMTNQEESGDGDSTSIEESIEYEVGKTETKTITTPGEVKRLTASVAIDGNLSALELTEVENMVSAAIGMNTDRGDDISVVSMNFATDDAVEEDEELLEQQRNKKIALFIGALLLVLLIIGAIIYKRRKDKLDDEYEGIDYIDDYDEDDLNRLANEGSKETSLEDEVRSFASKSPEEVTELLKTWLNE